MVGLWGGEAWGGDGVATGRRTKTVEESRTFLLCLLTLWDHLSRPARYKIFLKFE